MPRPAPLAALLRAVLLTMLVGWLVVRAATPPAPTAADAPAAVFSAARAMRHVTVMAQRPHPTGSADAARVRAYVVAELGALGLTAEVQGATGVGTRYQETGRIENVVARLGGTTPGGPAVLLMAHTDGVPAGPAAGDDASGSAVLLETLRALRAGPPLAHDVIALFTDGEEAGLLGAAAFVREHRWAKDVAVTLNFEARGTTGRAFMFETGPGNLDIVRVLRQAPDVSANSLMVTVYRTLPNDTDLSELAVLERPALNFAFAGRVDRYHTTQDDVAHLNPGSIQHEGAQALAVTRALGAGPLPRPITGDAVFFDFPVVGLVVYPEWLARPLAVAAAVLVVVVAVAVRRRERRWIRDLILGVVATVLSVVLGGGGAFLAGIGITRIHDALTGTPALSGLYAAAIIMLALTVSAACWALIRRWGSSAGTQLGALVVWACLTIWITWLAPGASFLFVWPLLAASVAILLHAREGAAREASLWVSTIVAAGLLVPVIYLIGVVLLGITTGGGVAMGVLTPLLAWVLAPQFEAIAGERRWRVTLAALAATAVLFAVGAATVRRSAAHPAASILVYAVDADAEDAWLATPAGMAGPGSWAALVLGPSIRVLAPAEKPEPGGPPVWLSQGLGRGMSMAVASVPRVAVALPTATVIADSLVEGGRRISLRITAPGALNVGVRLADGPVIAAAVDGRVIDTARYRRTLRQWRISYSAPPDSGFVLALTLPRGTTPVLELTAQSAGIAALPGRPIPARPDDILPAQMGDVTIAYRRVEF